MRLLLFLLLGAVMIPAAAHAGGAAPGFELKIEASGGAGFAGEGRVEGADGVEVVRLQGAAPLIRNFTGERLSCEIEQTTAEGALAVEARKANGNNVSRSATHGKGSKIKFSMT
jgi:hypothetical protein